MHIKEENVKRTVRGGYLKGWERRHETFANSAWEFEIYRTILG